MAYVTRSFSFHRTDHKHLIDWIDGQPNASARIRQLLETALSGADTPQANGQALPDYSQLLADIRDIVDAGLQGAGVSQSPASPSDADQLAGFEDFLS